MDLSHADRRQPERHPALTGTANPHHPPVHPRRFDESSWVEVSSQPSSSSLSSIGDEIVTTGLQVGGGAFGRRRRLQGSSRGLGLGHQQTAIYNGGSSSQEEYDESESEDDHVMTSSGENMNQHPPSDDAESDDDGDNATALGRRPPEQPVFRPQPNAFNYPPSSSSAAAAAAAASGAGQHHRSYSSSSAVPPSHPNSAFTRPSFSQRSQTTRVHRGGPNFMSPAAREDNDAALRASLTTLLSCAAAARGLPKTRAEAEAQREAGRGVGPSNQPVGLRLVPESELMADRIPNQGGAVPPPSVTTESSVPRSSSQGTSSDRSKRSISASRSSRAAKKKKTAACADETTALSPTFLTWVVSAGVVVLVSVVGFGAGYVMGREVGHQEALSASAGGFNETSSCGREVMRSSGGGLRRLKWSAVGRSIVAA